MIPNVSVTPTLEEIQDVLVLAGKHISGLSKGVAQWTGGKTPRVTLLIFHYELFYGLCSKTKLGQRRHSNIVL